MTHLLSSKTIDLEKLESLGYLMSSMNRVIMKQE
jgi:hypothetical protein